MSTFWRAAIGHLAVSAAVLAAAWLLSDTFAVAASAPTPSDLRHLFC